MSGLSPLDLEMKIFWQIRARDYLDSELRLQDSTSTFRLPDAWWLGNEPIAEEFKPLLITAARPQPEDPDFFYHDVLPFVSADCRNVMSARGGFAGEFHPASLTTKSGASVKNPYWYFRLFTRLDAIDPYASEIEYFPGTQRPRRVWKLKLNLAKLQEHEVFRLAKVEAIFASDGMKSAMESAGLRVAFSPAEHFRLGW